MRFFSHSSTGSFAFLQTGGGACVGFSKTAIVIGTYDTEGGFTVGKCNTSVENCAKYLKDNDV